MTAGSVTARIDFKFRIVEQRLGRDIAEAFQLGIEYDPEPIASGVAETARPEILVVVKTRVLGNDQERTAKITAAAAALKRS